MEKIENILKKGIFSINITNNTNQVNLLTC